MLHDGDLVEFHYRGTLDSGEEFDSSYGRRARAHVLGRGQLLPAFETAIKSMSPGEKASFRLSPDEAYGQRDPALVIEVPRTEAPAGTTVGDMLQLSNGWPATVVAMDDETVTLDANHQLAGMHLNFEVELRSARPAAT